MSDEVMSWTERNYVVRSVGNSFVTLCDKDYLIDLDGLGYSNFIVLVALDKLKVCHLYGILKRQWRDGY